MLRVAKGRTLEYGSGQLQNLPEKLIELGKHHKSAWVWDLWENIWGDKYGSTLLFMVESTTQWLFEELHDGGRSFTNRFDRMKHK